MGPFLSSATTREEILSRFANLDREMTEEGLWRVKTSADGRHHIDVVRMIFNWRVATTPVATPYVFARWWCYKGTGPAAFVTAALAALAWDGSDNTEPAGWNKNGQTGEWRDNG